MRRSVALTLGLLLAGLVVVGLLLGLKGFIAAVIGVASKTRL